MEIDVGYEADVIVVGAGTAGCVVARRMADAGARVLLLEAGPDGRDPAVTDPARMHELWDSPLDWAFRTVPQWHADRRRLHLPRGRTVGGSHALNGMIWARGNPADYDAWEAAGNPGWGWHSVRPVFERCERTFGLLTDYRPNPAHESIVLAAQQAGVPYNPDYNGPRQDGVSYLRFTIAEGLRAMTADIYLRPAVDRGVSLIPDAQVTRLLFQGTRCVGVEWLREGVLERAYAAHETVLCAGAIGSPTLLLRSGLGDAAALRGAGVDVVTDLPEVGRNLQDHWLVPVIASVSRPVPPSPGLPHTQSHLFWRSDPRLDLPDLQPIHFDQPLYEPWMTGPPDGITLLAGLVRPASWVTIRISSPTGQPLIDPRVLSSRRDVVALTAAVRLCQEIVAAPALRDAWGAEELYPGRQSSTRELEDYIRRAVVTYHHQSGTCAMGTVVDPALRVYGVDGLRVADASVMPRIPTGNTNAPTIVIAERAAASLV